MNNNKLEAFFKKKKENGNVRPGNNEEKRGSCTRSKVCAMLFGSTLNRVEPARIVFEIFLERRQCGTNRRLSFGLRATSVSMHRTTFGCLLPAPPTVVEADGGR